MHAYAAAKPTLHVGQSSDQPFNAAAVGMTNFACAWDERRPRRKRSNEMTAIPVSAAGPRQELRRSPARVRRMGRGLEDSYVDASAPHNKASELRRNGPAAATFTT
jgi:hypothetical protein